jgi:predicted ATPase
MMNRQFTVPYTLGDACFLNFSDLCEKDKGVADYRALCDRYSDIYIYGIPIMSVANHNEARRFITLIDELYDAGVRLTWTSDTDPNDLFAVEAILSSDSAQEFLGIDHKWGQSDSCVYGKYSKDNKGVSNNSGTGHQSESLQPPGTSRLMSTVDINKSTAQIKFEGRTEELDILEGELASVQELSFAFRRAASRMMEMSSEQWRRTHHAS